ncbi:MAG TPA: hypothetical protein VJ602_01590 [Paludibacter sp.]|nr:hypothetical protein [Paludibacter sp.]
MNLCVQNTTLFNFKDLNRSYKDKRQRNVHWRSDIDTPRGPGKDIRPTPAQCKRRAVKSGFSISKELLLEPYHFGIIINKPLK